MCFDTPFLRSRQAPGAPWVLHRKHGGHPLEQVASLKATSFAMLKSGYSWNTLQPPKRINESPTADLVWPIISKALLGWCSSQTFLCPSCDWKEFGTKLWSCFFQIPPPVPFSLLHVGIRFDYFLPLFASHLVNAKCLQIPIWPKHRLQKNLLPRSHIYINI